MTKKALLVGINDYKSINDLQGCVNDITNMRSILQTYLGFTNAQTRILLDSRATKANIMNRLQWLVRGAKAGDYLFFHYSGHGSQIRDRNNDDLKDNMDELICPWDMDWDGTYIIDDDFNALFSKLPGGVTLEVVLDCCHSGTGLKEANLGRPAELGPANGKKDRYLPPPLDIVCRHEGEEDQLKPTTRLLRRDLANQILWAGCRDNQTSADAEINGTYNGAFTYYFCKHLRDANGAISRAELLKRVRASLRYNDYDQVPQLECNKAAAGFNVLTPKGK